MKPSVVVLPGKDNYAVMIPGAIFYGLGAKSKKELVDLVKEVEEYASDIDSSVSESTVSTISLIPTFNCNLRCIYCYARGGECKKELQLATAIEAIKSIKEIENKDRLKINLLGGGEPLLNLEIVKKIETYARSLFIDVEISVVTNATFGKRTLDWIIASKVIPLVSYDGAMQDRQRPYRDGKSSKKKVTQNVRKMVDAGVPLIVSCVVTAEGINTLRETLDELVALGVKTVEFEAARGTDVGRKTGWMEPDPELLAEALLDVIEHAATLDEEIKIYTSYFSAPRKVQGYCGISGGNKVVTPDGLVTACLEISKLTDPYADKIIYGKIDRGTISVDLKKLTWLKNFDNLADRGGCLKCNLLMICQGGCPMSGVWEKGLPLRKSGYTCVVEHTFLPKLLLRMAEEPKIVEVVANEAQILC